MSIELIVDEALGPGLDVVRDTGTGEPRAARARNRGPWLGLDRAHLTESDAGDGTELAAVVAVPVSSFVGCRITTELDGALVEGPRTVLVGHIARQPPPLEAIARTVAGIGPRGTWMDAAAAARFAHDARVRYRVRRQEGRVLGGRAWRPLAGTDPGARRFTTPHSRSEYRLEHLPPRFLRGLEGVLDDGERILYAIERPANALRPRRLTIGAGVDRRAALLMLTDRQLIWMVDHMAPDRYLFDWGIDARLVSLEALVGIHPPGPGRNGTVELQAVTRGGSTVFALPIELRAEAEVMRDLLARFLPGASDLPARRYAPVAVGFDPTSVERFGQAREADAAIERLRDHLAPEPLLGALYAPRRERVPDAAAVALTATRVAVEHRREVAVVDLRWLRDVSLVLSPLVGRVTVQHLGTDGRPASVGFTYPATLASQATQFLRLLRAAWADRASLGCGGAQDRDSAAGVYHAGRTEVGP